jgi:hypothetical protein
MRINMARLLEALNMIPSFFACERPALPSREASAMIPYAIV